MLEDLLRARREKLEKFKDAGLEPFPEKTERSATVFEAINKFSQWSRAKKRIILAGRLTGLRYHGGAVFGDLKDATASVQLLFKRDILSDKFDVLQYFDIGDFIAVEGVLFRTKAGERTLEVKNFSMLTKALRPVPATWYGLEDVEERFRKRHLDLLANPEVYARFLKRSKVITLLRQFARNAGFIEVETPILQTLYGGAAAKPFRTRLDILDIPLYLRIAPELYLKRLLVGGFEKIYELGRVFRNEGIDREHNPEFTMMELYWAYQDRDGLMEFCEELFDWLLENFLGKKKRVLTYQGKEINFARPYRRISFSDVIKETIGLSYDSSSEEELKKRGEERGLKFERGKTKGKIADDIFKKLFIPGMTDPTFIVDHPLEISPLAKSKENKAQRFQLLCAGWEVVNGFSELNDPIDQRVRFEGQEKLRRAGDEEAQPIDENFIEALEYGMPPAAGWGIGVDRLVAILTDAPSLKEVIFFPLMKPRD